jgi:hypothetical protein
MHVEEAHAFVTISAGYGTLTIWFIGPCIDPFIKKLARALDFRGGWHARHVVGHGCSRRPFFSKSPPPLLSQSVLPNPRRKADGGTTSRQDVDKKFRRETHPLACSGVMNPTAFLRPFRVLVAATLLSGLAPGTACAQKKIDPSAPIVGAPAPAEPVRLDFDMSGNQLTVQEAADAIVKGFRKAGQTASVVVRGEAGALGLPSINLQRVTFPQAVEALVLATEPPLVFEGGENLFVISANIGDRAPAKVRAFNVSQFLRRPENWSDDEKQRRIEENRHTERFDALQAVIAKGLALGAKVNPNFVKPEVEIEDRVGILFATGSPQALEIVAEVVRALCEPYAKPAPPAKPEVSNVTSRWTFDKPAPPAKP